MERKSTAGYHEVEAGNKVDSLSADSFTGHHELLRVMGVDYRGYQNMFGGIVTVYREGSLPALI